MKKLSENESHMETQEDTSQGQGSQMKIESSFSDPIKRIVVDTSVEFSEENKYGEHSIHSQSLFINILV